VKFLLWLTFEMVFESCALLFLLLLLFSLSLSLSYGRLGEGCFLREQSMPLESGKPAATH